MENTVNERELHVQEEINEEVNDNLEAVKEEIQDQSEEDKTNIEDGAKELDGLKNELEEYKSRFMRLSADFQNYKKRMEKERSDLYKFGSEKIVVDILPIIDNFERAIQASENNGEESASFLDGVEMIFKQFIEMLNKHGVQEIESIEKEFDPNLHHAVMQEECEESESNMVTEVFQKGYTLNDKVIRPSMVKVSK